MNTQELPRPLYVRPPQLDAAKPFDGDLFERAALAKRLTDYLSRLQEGCVIAIDAPWGEGKTWFGRNWAAQLQSDGFQTIYYDAFAQDHADDPFVSIVSEFYAAARNLDGPDAAERLLKPAKKLGRSLIPLGGKVALNVLGRLALGTTDLSDELVKTGESLGEGLADAAEALIEEQIKRHDEQKRSLEGFRDALTSFAASKEKPVVFFIDELDRCSPAFAVKVIERLKHIFDVRQVVFVLLLNRIQLERAIAGVYGEHIDAHAYLGKFVHLFLSLPKQFRSERVSADHNWKYAHEVAKRYRVDWGRDDYRDPTIDCLSQLATAFSLSLRDIEKAMVILVLSNSNATASFLTWPIVIKLKHPTLFQDLRRGSPSAHIKAREILNGAVRSRGEYWHYDYFDALHVLMGHGKAQLDEKQLQALREKGPREIRFDQDELFRIWLQRIDLPIDL